ncbi:uncharacterized protein MELLADRAFT_113241 [Melampsora larici-populina 98AG31]|uniref:Secreted protein n=1 Tax=Melampsora larici-populina (strain 98AG31 / pathotype 3-4-7) TaxID=747676 RepID=F4S980_MELLP|nr:uncharacterized protein MELLADRAFT_113241 [Melampsora larici-populina 98AG31]EGF98811.1 hypothetical protein MELLADRAFT_113241 [Melampsora larici-populina 98AG31]
MKLSSVAISASALALTASAAIIPLQSPTSIKSRSTHKDEHNGDHHHTKPSMNIRKKDMRRSRIRSMMYVDNNRHIHGSDVVVESYRGHGHDTVAIPLHHHSVEYVEGRVHRDHKRSTHYSYVPNYLPGVPYAQTVGAPVMTRVITSRPKTTVINEYVPGRTHTSIHEVSYMNLPPKPKVVTIPGYVPGRGHTSIHQHIHYRRKSRHGSPKSNSPNRFAIKHGKPGKSGSQKGEAAGEAGDSKKQKHSEDSSESEAASKKQSHGEASKSNKKSGKHSQLSERSISTSGSVTQSGVPGFIEVATPLFKSALAKAVSGLTYSTTNGSNFDLTTSDTQSTQFFMSPMNNTVGPAAFQLRIPILDSTTFQTVDHCATFALSPPGPLSLQKCGPVPGCSQAFAYNDVSGKIEPIYGSNAAPSNSNSTSHSSSSPSGTYRMTQMDSSANSTSMSNSSTPSNSTTSNDSTSNGTAPLFTQDSSAYQNSLNGSSDSVNSSMTIQNGTAQNNVTASGSHSFLATPESTSLNSTSTEVQKDSPSPPAALYFVPAQGFYQAPATIDQVLDSTSSAATAASPAPIGRNVVASADDGSDDNDDDDDDDSDQVLNRAVIDPVTGAAGAAGAPVPATPNNRSGVNTEQVLGDGNDAGEDVAETQDEVKSDEAEDAAILASQ